VESATDPEIEMGSFNKGFDMEDDDDDLTIQDGLDGKYDGDFTSINGEYGEDEPDDDIAAFDAAIAGGQDGGGDDAANGGEEMDLDDLQDLDDIEDQAEDL
jgi:hypothetical protein